MNPRPQNTVAIIAPYFPPHGGGSERYAYEIAFRLKKDLGWRVIFISSGERLGKDTREEVDGIIVYRLVKGYYLKDWRYEFYKAKQIYVLPLNRKVPKQIDGDSIELSYLDVKILPQVLNIIANKLP